jgi:hypothetical protein
MGMNLGAGFAAGAGGDALAEVLKQKFTEAMARQKLAEDVRQANMQNAVQQRQLGQGDQRIGLDQQKFGEDTRQFNVSSGQADRRIGQQDRVIGMDEAIQPTRIRQMTAQAADLERRPIAEQEQRDFTSGRDRAQHGYQMSEIGAQGANALRVANVRHPDTAGAAATQKEQNEIADSLALINELRNDPALKSSVGPFEGRGGGYVSAGPEGYTRVQALHDNLVNRLSLAQAGKLKGQGTISNLERDMLSKAATALTRNLGDSDYLNQLDKVEEQFKRNVHPLGGGRALAGAPSGGGMMRARDPQGNLHEAPAGTPLPAGWKPER